MSRTYKDKRKHEWGYYKDISSDWKRLRRKQRKAKNKDEMAKGKEISDFPKTDADDWH